MSAPSMAETLQAWLDEYGELTDQVARLTQERDELKKQLPSGPLNDPLRILIRFDLYSTGGKWKYGGEVEVQYREVLSPEVLFDEQRLLRDVDRNQNEVIRGTVVSGDYFVVLSDSPEQRRNPAGHFFMNRLYSPDEVKRIVRGEKRR
jgi:hypothetical protein